MRTHASGRGYGRLVSSGPLEWKDIPLGQLAGQVIGCDVQVDTDVNAGALADLCYGCARDPTEMLYISWGTESAMKLQPQRIDWNPARRYHEKVQQILSQIVDSQMEAMRRAACMVAETVRRDGLIYTLGSGHSLLIAAELYFRAGGLVNFDVIHDKTFGRAERLSGYAEVLLDSYPISSRDLLIIVSNSGRNCLPVELAVEARKRRISTVAITSLKHSRAVSSRLPGGIRLFEVCDLVIDNCGVPGDSVVELGDEPSLRVGPTSTLAGIFIVHCIVSMAVSQLLESGVQPPVFVSANLDDGDRKNRQLIEFMRQRIRGL